MFQTFILDNESYKKKLNNKSLRFDIKPPARSDIIPFDSVKSPPPDGGWYNVLGGDFPMGRDYG
ncbi:hypothetical protein P615_18220 [Brevibacillus laterosporus PE36]|nr:hypothetical protein P615_18220 [Brevibacillus laterosporus PE36]